MVIYNSTKDFDAEQIKRLSNYRVSEMYINDNYERLYGAEKEAKDDDFVDLDEVMMDQSDDERK